MTEQLFLDRRDAAKTAGVSIDTLTRAIATGALKAKRSGKDAQGNGTGKYLVSRQALEEWFSGLADA